MNFARDNRLRLVVKGAGHSYQGTSNAPDSLLIWTRAMNEVTLHDAFMPQGGEGKATPCPAVTAGAGAVWIDLYHAVTSEAGRYVQGGGCTDVGVAGLVQSGGFGSFSKGFGTAAAGLLEAEIVTADGAVRVANACTNPDLFWALKGGGGGSWGVVTQLTLRTHDLPAFGAAWGAIRAQSDAAFRRLIAHFFDFYADKLFNPHWGEQIRLGPDNTLELAMVCQGLDNAQVGSIWQPFFDWVKASPQDFFVSDSALRGRVSGAALVGFLGQPFNDPGSARRRARLSRVVSRRPGSGRRVPLWLRVALAARVLAARRGAASRLSDALFAASRHKKIGLQFNKGLAGAPDEAIAAARDTATNPAVTEAFALAIIADGEGPRFPGLPRPALDEAAARSDARAIDLAAAELRRIAPDAGSYVSESNYFNSSWQDAFWGSNYPRLREVKAKYDPDGLFFVHHGVGSEEWSADGFTTR